MIPGRARFAKCRHKLAMAEFQVADLVPVIRDPRFTQPAFLVFYSFDTHDLVRNLLLPKSCCAFPGFGETSCLFCPRPAARESSPVMSSTCCQTRPAGPLHGPGLTYLSGLTEPGETVATDCTSGGRLYRSNQASLFASNVHGMHLESWQSISRFHHLSLSTSSRRIARPAGW